MMKLKVFNKESQVVGDIELSIGEKAAANAGVLFNRVVRTMLMNKRQGTASAKSRGFVSGGGKKPWKQKGTGRARAGSIRSPLFVGGGVIFGPKPKDYDLKLNKKEKKLAFSEAVAQRAKEDGIIVLDELNFDAPKTKEAYEVLKKLGAERALVVLENGMENTYLSFRNIRGIEVKNIDTLNTYDILRFKKIIAPKSVIEKINGRIVNG
jgi:large subunit ribosomal protein L4